MAMICKVCSHPRLHRINAQLVMQAEAISKISRQYSVPVASLYRHRRVCLPELHAAMRTSMAAVEAKSILDQMRALHTRCMDVLARAEATDQLDVALRAVRECRGNLELLGRLDGTLSPQSGAGGPVSISVTYVDKQLVQQDGPNATVIEAHSEEEGS